MRGPIVYEAPRPPAAPGETVHDADDDRAHRPIKCEMIELLIQAISRDVVLQMPMPFRAMSMGMTVNVTTVPMRVFVNFCNI